RLYFVDASTLIHVQCNPCSSLIHLQIKYGLFILESPPSISLMGSLDSRNLLHRAHNRPVLIIVADMQLWRNEAIHHPASGTQRLADHVRRKSVSVTKAKDIL